MSFVPTEMLSDLHFFNVIASGMPREVEMSVCS